MGKHESVEGIEDQVQTLVPAQRGAADGASA